MSSPENFKHRRDVLFSPFDGSRKTGVIFFCVSLMVHVLFFLGMIFFQEFRLSKPMPPVIQVDLVSFSAEPVTQESPGKEEISKEEISKEEGISVTPLPNPPPKESPIIPSIKPDISLKTKPENLKDLMAQQEKKKKEAEEKKPVIEPKPQKAVDPDKIPKESKENLEKNIENQNKTKIAQALNSIEKRVQEQGTTKQGEGNPGSAGSGKKGYTPIDLYKMVLASQVEQNWVFNDILARLDQNLEVRILIKILKSGEIRDIIYETRSGNQYLDESAKKAIKKTNPLPPLPSGMYSYDVVVIFTPKGLK